MTTLRAQTAQAIGPEQQELKTQPKGNLDRLNVMNAVHLKKNNEYLNIEKGRRYAFQMRLDIFWLSHFHETNSVVWT